MYNDTDDRRRYEDAGRRQHYDQADDGVHAYDEEQAAHSGYQTQAYEAEHQTGYDDLDQNHRHYAEQPHYEEAPERRSRLVPVLTIVAAVLVVAIGVVAALYFLGILGAGRPATSLATTAEDQPVQEASAPEADLGPSVRSVSPDGGAEPLAEEGAPNPDVPQAVVSIAPPAQGEPPVRSSHGDWQVRCDTPAGAQGEQCVLMQFVTAEDRDNVGLTVIVLKTADQKARIMRILAPLGVLLPSGLGLKIDSTDIGRAGFVRCLPNGCVAEVILEDTLLTQLQSGQTATFIIFQTPEEGIGIPISLAGFGEGFSALP